MTQGGTKKKEREKSFSSQFAQNYGTEARRAQREARGSKDRAEETEKKRIQGIFAGTGLL